MIIIDRERYLKHIVTDLETLNEPSSTDFPVLGNYSCDSYFGNFYPLSSNVPLTQNSEMIFREELSTAAEETLLCQEPALEITEQTKGKEESNKKEEDDTFYPQKWALYFDGSKSQEGLGAGCILINLKGKRNFLPYRLEFECTNNTIDYESLVQGIKKAIDLNVKELKVFEDSEIIIRQVRNIMH
jgi:hypothetical protein